MIFNQVISEIILDFLESYLVDWNKNSFVSEEKQIMLMKNNIDFSNILILGEFNSIFINQLYKKDQENKIQYASTHSNLEKQIQDTKTQNLFEIIFYKKGDWPFKLNFSNMICAYFFLDQMNEKINDENELYKMLTLIYYTLKDSGIFINIFFGPENLFSFKELVYKFLETNQNFCFEKIFQEPLEFNQILHNMQKIGFKNSVLIDEKINLNFKNFQDFFDFLKNVNLFEKIFSTSFDFELIKNDLFLFLNENYQVSENNSFELQFEIMIIYSET